MKTKLYPVEIVAKVTKALTEAPALPPKTIDHTNTIAELSGLIKDMHLKKNYDAREITQFLKQKGIKITQREVRSIIITPPQKRVKNEQKIEKENDVS